MTDWQPETIEHLKQAWAKGESVRSICHQLHSNFQICFTRSAVIGKAHRLNLGPSKYHREKTPPQRRRLEQLPIVNSSKLTIDQLRSNMCRWPLNDGNPRFYFCGALTQRLYCTKHEKLAYRF
jgi:hypothetical protein